MGAGQNDDVRAILEMLDPKTRDHLRRVLTHDQADRDAVSSQLLRYRDGHGDDWADIIDMLTMHPEARRRVARVSVRPRRRGLREAKSAQNPRKGTKCRDMVSTGATSKSQVRPPIRPSLQVVEPRGRTHNPPVAGSSPARPTMKGKVRRRLPRHGYFGDA